LNKLFTRRYQFVNANTALIAVTTTTRVTVFTRLDRWQAGILFVGNSWPRSQSMLPLKIAAASVSDQFHPEE
jgi:hypothetical protein